MQAQQQITGWHIRNWGAWGWLETAVKAIGIVAGLVALTQALSSDPSTVTGLANIAAIAILGLLTLAYAGVVFIRLSQREIASLIFAISNALGHLGMLLYLIRTPEPNMLPVVLGVAFIVGELVKQRFLTVTGFTENGLQSAQMVMFSRVVMGIYLIFTVLVLV
ncbi:MAG: hypothetical protein OHK0046_20710 [Anaerolineae bacterium]